MTAGDCYVLNSFYRRNVDGALINYSQKSTINDDAKFVCLWPDGDGISMFRCSVTEERHRGLYSGLYPCAGGKLVHV